MGLVIHKPGKLRQKLRWRGRDLTGKCITVPEEIPASKWAGEVTGWCRTKRIPNMADAVVRFFAKAFRCLPREAFEQAWFGTHSNYISLTVGNIWLASVWSARKSVWLIVDKKWDRSIGSTLRYIPLGWKIAPWHTLSQINASEQIWESYAVAAVKVLASPMSRLIIPKNLVNKQKLRDVTGGFTG
jgi:hypothetical protein